MCAGQSISNQAVTWCPECEEAHCSECIKHHGIAKATKDHQVIAVEKYLKLPTFLLEIKHDYHKKCSDLPPLDDVIQDAKSSVAFMDIEERFHSLKKFYSEGIKEKEANVNNLKVRHLLCTKEMDKELYKTEKEVDVLCDDGSLKRHSIEFVIEDQMESFTQDLKSLGEITSSYEQTEIIHAKSILKQAQIVAVPCKHVESMNLVLKGR
ncbi:unnamed protein product [Mytilus edulis]|uniref:B box-type domain-containing protein n=1 Tax=Mytilus edulis TaxID=6550 RepID=A0A8S3PWJ0_MYTED|nr:unnamed protein product [Mytilus edulis]